jgi:hypothetical protein
MHATSLLFWGIMSLATLVGFVIAYPFNLWLVGVRLKHGMGTERALGHGGHKVATEFAAWQIDSENEYAQPVKSMAMVPQVTTVQVLAMATLTIIVLAAGIMIAALSSVHAAT